MKNERETKNERGNEMRGEGVRGKWNERETEIERRIKIKKQEIN